MTDKQIEAGLRSLRTTAPEGLMSKVLDRLGLGDAYVKVANDQGQTTLSEVLAGMPLGAQGVVQRVRPGAERRIGIGLGRRRHVGCRMFYGDSDGIRPRQ